jgi:TonB family protein
MRIIVLFTALWSLLVAQVLVAPELLAHDTDPAQVYRVGGGVSPPGLLHQVEPTYSEEAMKAGLEGKVLLQAVVGTDGKARDVKVLRGLGLGLDENAVAGVGAWEFVPGKKDGQPVNVQVRIEESFGSLEKEPNNSWHVTRVEFHLADGAGRPVIEKAVAPPVGDRASSATASVKFDIYEKGEPGNVRIEKSSDQGWARDVAAALGHWRFTPASKNGNPVSVSCGMDFVRGH